MTIDVYINLDDIGLFRRARKHEGLSQYDRAKQVRDQFAHCMTNAMRCHAYCVMPELCANGVTDLRCLHLHVDYSNFTGRGIKLTRNAAKLIDERLRATGTLVYRNEAWDAWPLGSLAGDIHLPALARIASFPAPRTARTLAGAAPKQPPPRKRGGFFGRLFGF